MYFLSNAFKSTKNDRGLNRVETRLINEERSEIIHGEDLEIVSGSNLLEKDLAGMTRKSGYWCTLDDVTVPTFHGS